jgi:hypothetical protein
VFPGSSVVAPVLLASLFEAIISIPVATTMFQHCATITVLQRRRPMVAMHSAVTHGDHSAKLSRQTLVREPCRSRETRILGLRRRIALNEVVSRRHRWAAFAL